MLSSKRGFARMMVSAAAVLVCALAVCAAPAVASSNLAWSGPFAVDPHQQPTGLTGVSCPSTTECVGIDGRGDETTFDPSSPQNVRIAPLSSHALTAVACPALTQCSAVDTSGQEVTFNPQAAGGANPVSVDGVGIPLGLACPAITQCTAVDTAGQEVTFNPQSAAGASPVTVDSGGILIGVDCPTAGSCYAVDTSGTAVTFSPQGGNQLAKPQSVDQSTPVAIQCPQGQCVVVDTGGGAHTFSSQGQGSTTIDGNGSSAVSLSGLSCVPDPSNGRVECSAVDVKGQEVSFDPVALASNKPASVDPGQTLDGVSCPVATQCTAVDSVGQEVTFDPRTPGTPTPVVVDGRTNLSALSCPTSGQCTAMDLQGGEVTFAPGSTTATSTGNVDPKTSAVYGVACPSATQCTAVDAEGQEVTFNPASPGGAGPTGIDSGHAIDGVACPSATQCTVVDDRGAELTFNPQNPGKPSPVTIAPGHGLPDVACPSMTQCTAIDDSGDEVTFNPQGPGAPGSVLVDATPVLALACPALNQCTAIDSAGRQVTFFPQSRSELAPETVEAGGQLTAIACRTATGCVVLDAAGHALEGDPGGIGPWQAKQVSGASLPAVACPSATECVSVDVPGNAFTGTSGPLPPVPRPLAPPSISGRAKQSRSLTTSNGTWSDQPTSYSYQWERCTGTGRRCAPIKGAVGPSYVLSVGDVGHRLRAEVWASNVSGSGAPQVSALTRVVAPLVSLAIQQGSLSGLAGGAPKLTLRLVVPTGQPPLKSVTIVLAHGLSLSRLDLASVRILGTHRHFRFRLRRNAGRLQVICLSRTTGIRLSLRPGPLKVSGALIARARRHRVHRLAIGLRVKEAYNGHGHFVLKLPAH